MSKIKKISDSEISAFCQQIVMVITAGLPTYYGISILMDEAPDEDTRQLLQKIYTPMEAGGTLCEALDMTKAFPDYMVHMVQLGEETGRLEEVMRSLSTYYDREASIRANIKHAVTYPLIMTVMMIAVIIVLLTKVLPVFSQIYEELGSELTGAARTLMNISNTLNHYLFGIVIAFCILLVVVIVLYRTNVGKMLFQGRGFAMTVAASRFSNSMYLALASGLDTDQGLELAKQLVNNPFMEAKIEHCQEHIKHGESFSNALLLSGIFSRIYSSWITIGNKTGSMDDVMKRIGIAYEQETENRLDRFISVLEPSLVILLSLFIGMILISFLLPLLGIMSSIG
ncbi:MAG: type II secretion system F family protein [Lachnospiraceae bacterium]|nr:type II secretion system F family protein [Lachnospiraceae bacterium]MDD6504172.1 type II secretion system F family protein [Lachnospiraceae bacterium]